MVLCGEDLLLEKIGTGERFRHGREGVGGGEMAGGLQSDRDFRIPGPRCWTTRDPSAAS